MWGGGHILLKGEIRNVYNILVGSVKLIKHLNLVPRSKNEWSYTSTPAMRLHDVVLTKSTRITLPFTFTFTIRKKDHFGD
jgi:hypothetical protein